MYKAFISYNRGDLQFVEKLHKKLETYAVPKAVELSELQARQGKPLHPIFRDVDEMVSGGSLSGRLRDAILNSEYLIVVCSRIAAQKGVWMDIEIREFLKKHGSDKILIVVIDGEPNAQNAGFPADMECMPPSLVALFKDPKSQPLWVDMRPEKKDQAAFLRLVAGLLSISSLDELVQRDAQRKLRRKQVLAGVASILFLTVGTLGFSAWQQRSLALEEQEFTALSRARNAILAGQSAEGYELLKEAYDAGIRGEIEEALVSMASWVPIADSISAADTPMILVANDEYDIIHPNGTSTQLTQKPEQIIYLDPDYSRAIIYSDYQLAIYDLATGKILDQKQIDLVLRNSAPVIAAPSGGVVLGMETDGGHLNSVRSYFVHISVDGTIGTAIETFPPISNDNPVGYLWRAQAPVAQGDCSYIGLLSSAEAERGNASREAVKTIKAYDFYEITSNELIPLGGIPDVENWYGHVPVDAFESPDLAHEPLILPPSPYEELDDNMADNFTGIGEFCADSIGGRISGERLSASFVNVSGAANREPKSWWKIVRYDPASDTSDEDNQLPNPCLSGNCFSVTSIESSSRAEGQSEAEFFAEFGYDWQVPSYPFELQRNTDNSRYMIGTQYTGQIGHGNAICLAVANGRIACASYKGNDMSGPGFSGARLANDGKWFFAATAEYREFDQELLLYFGFEIVNLSGGKSHQFFEKNGARYFGQLTDFSPNNREFATLNSDGNLEIYSFSANSLEPRIAIDTAFVGAFDPYDGIAIGYGASEGSAVPIALIWVDSATLIIMRQDGAIGALSSKTGEVIWQSRIGGLGVVSHAILSPDRDVIAIVGSGGARLIDAVSGMPTSGIFGYPENTIALDPFKRVFQSDGTLTIGNVTRPKRKKFPASDAMLLLKAYFEKD